MNKRKADAILATVIALTFAAFAAGGAFYLRTLDSWGRQLEEKIGADAYPRAKTGEIDLGQPEKADAYALTGPPVSSATTVAEALPAAVSVVCACVVAVAVWVVPIHRRSIRSNPPRAPAC